jgi:hypothetical protein
MNTEILYFAYGSNLNGKDWQRWFEEKGYEDPSSRQQQSPICPILNLSSIIIHRAGRAVSSVFANASVR